MKLSDWMERENETPASFAQRIERSAEAVRRYMTGARIPDRVTMPVIVEKTDGQVTPNDFFDLSVPLDASPEKVAA